MMTLHELVNRAPLRPVIKKNHNLALIGETSNTCQSDPNLGTKIGKLGGFMITCEIIHLKCSSLRHFGLITSKASILMYVNMILCPNEDFLGE